MNIEDSRTKTIFRNEYEGKTYYKMGISHKKQDGSWENGTIACRFPKEANIPDKTKIMIVQGWIDFYLKDKATIPYIFVNKYELVDTQVPQNTKTVYDDMNSDVQLSDKEIDEVFKKQEETFELPF